MLAEQTGETMTRAVTEALRERLARVSRGQRPETAAADLLAILFGENDAGAYAASIAKVDCCRISVATFVEVSIVIEAQTKGNGSRQLDAFMRRAGITVDPVTEELAHLARQAFIDFGKGRHAAALNFGDCFSYALAKASREPLLYKG